MNENFARGHPGRFMNGMKRSAAWRMEECCGAVAGAVIRNRPGVIGLMDRCSDGKLGMAGSGEHFVLGGHFHFGVTLFPVFLCFEFFGENAFAVAM